MIAVPVEPATAGVPRGAPRTRSAVPRTAARLPAALAVPLAHFALLVPLLLLALSGCGPVPPTDEAESERPAPVTVTKIATATFGEWTMLPGFTVPAIGHAGRVTAPVEGRLRWIVGGGAHGSEGQIVHAGQVIAQLDDALVAAGRAKLVAGLEEQEEVERQAKLSIDMARIDSRRLDKLDRARSTITGVPLVSHVEVDRSRVTVADAESRARGAAARQKTIRADLAALDVQLELYRLRAPVDGALGLVQAVPGQTLAAGAAVADVLDLRQIDVLAQAPPGIAGRLSVGQTAVVSLPAHAPGAAPATLTGAVSFVGQQAVPDTGCFPVKVTLANGSGALSAGAVVIVALQTVKPAPRPALPAASVFLDREPPGVLLVTDLKTKKEGKEEHTIGKVRMVDAALGLRDPEHQQIEILGLFDPKSKAPIPASTAVVVQDGGPGLQDDDAVSVEEKGKDEHEEARDKPGEAAKGTP